MRSSKKATENILKAIGDGNKLVTPNTAGAYDRDGDTVRGIIKTLNGKGVSKGNQAFDFDFNLGFWGDNFTNKFVPITEKMIDISKYSYISGSSKYFKTIKIPKYLFSKPRERKYPYGFFVNQLVNFVYKLTGLGNRAPRAFSYGIKTVIKQEAGIPQDSTIGEDNFKAFMDALERLTNNANIINCYFTYKVYKSHFAKQLKDIHDKRRINKELLATYYRNLADRNPAGMIVLGKKILNEMPADDLKKVAIMTPDNVNKLISDLNLTGKSKIIPALTSTKNISIAGGKVKASKELIDPSNKQVIMGTYYDLKSKFDDLMEQFNNRETVRATTKAIDRKDRLFRENIETLEDALQIRDSIQRLAIDNDLTKEFDDNEKKAYGKLQNLNISPDYSNIYRKGVEGQYVKRNSYELTDVLMPYADQQEELSKTKKEVKADWSKFAVPVKKRAKPE